MKETERDSPILLTAVPHYFASDTERSVSALGWRKQAITRFDRMMSEIAIFRQLRSPNCAVELAHCQPKGTANHSVDCQCAF